MRTRTDLKTAAACVAVLCAACFAAGCDFNPVNFVSRNACEFVNCDELFFIDDLFPLSAAPTGDSGSGGGMDMDMDAGGGH